MTQESTNIISSAEKTLELLEFLARNNGKISVSEIAKRMNIHVSSADRYMLTLQKSGFVEKNPVSGYFHLNEKIIALADLVSQSHPLTKKYLNTMHTLAYQYNTTTHIMAFHNKNTITLHKDLQTQNMAFNNAFFDPTRYYYCSGPGKLLLSTFTDEELDDYLRRTRIIIFTKNTLPTADAIREEIRRIRQRGYSYHDEEWLPGNLTLSFPLRVNGDIRGAMSLMCAIERKAEMLSEVTIDNIKSMLREPMDL
ncbi:MAG: helix-turn-helix domain-containing protein [Oscillospiraceae bacterium]|nr:helix-turn-helix domain-containing protein [Oscillospiraceae bacterium]